MSAPQPDSWILDPGNGSEASALDVIDHLLDKGCVVTGQLVLGLAEIDLVYVELSLLLCGADRLLEKAGQGFSGSVAEGNHSGGAEDARAERPEP